MAEVVAQGRTVTVTSTEALVPEWDDGHADHHDVPVEPGTRIVIDAFEGPDGPMASRLRLGRPPRSSGGAPPGSSTWTRCSSGSTSAPRGSTTPMTWQSQLARSGRAANPAAGTTLDIDDDGRGDLLVLEPYGGYGEVFVGVDARGTIREVVISWFGTPWRQLGLAGDAPAGVLAREAQLRACLEGTRPIGIDGTCTTDEG